MSLLEVFYWLEYSAPLVAMRSSPWFFPVIATIHLFGLATIGGAVVVLDLRLLGTGIDTRAPSVLARGTDPLLFAGLAIMAPTGLLLFLCFATKYYYLTAFWTKLIALTSALTLAFGVRRSLRTDRGQKKVLAWRKPLASLSLALWFSVAVSGRLIGFP